MMRGSGCGIRNVMPRGGSVWLGTLLEFFKAIDIDSGVVRTAMSRLANDGWLERNKVGRNNFYRLADKGRLTSGGNESTRISIASEGFIPLAPRHTTASFFVRTSRGLTCA
jgi:hypothetical protein